MEKNIIIKTIIISSIIILIMVLILSSLFIYKKQNTNKVQTYKYNEKARKAIKELNISDILNDLDYSRTIEVMLENKTYQEKYLSEYQKIEYQEINNFSNIINTLLDKNYQSEEINYLIKHYLKDLNIILNMDYINILEFKDIKNFKINNLSRYLNYQKINNYDLETVVTYVNIGLDLEGYSKYTNYTIEEANNDLTILVNKYHKLPENYEPNDLVDLSYKNGNYTYKLRKRAAEDYERLTSAALLDNIIFYPYSAYRSYETQNYLYTRYKERDGELKADTYSARPGFSEHQLGLAVDVRSNTLSDNLTDKDYKWMLDNSYKYGFIVRYPKGKQHITQFMEEPWHLRYLGSELATKVHDSNLTYDEYYDLYLEQK